MVDRHSEVKLKAITLTAVSYCYPNSGLPVLNDINLTLETGRITAIGGANGSGKSSLVKIISGLVPPTSGTVTFPNGETSRPLTAIVFQNPSEQLLAGDVASELAFGLENFAVRPSEMEPLIHHTAERFGLTEHLLTPSEQLSDGMKQLLAIASAVIIRPQFLILDEPTAFLDPYWTLRIREIIGSLKQECGIIWVTGKAVEARLADYLYCLNQAGSMGWEGKPSDPEWQAERYGTEPSAIV